MVCSLGPFCLIRARANVHPDMATEEGWCQEEWLTNEKAELGPVHKTQLGAQGSLLPLPPPSDHPATWSQRNRTLCRQSRHLCWVPDYGTGEQS